MLGSTRRVRAHAYGAAVDMRKSFDTLSALVVHTMKRELLGGDCFLFVGKDRKRAKVLYWDGTGLCLLAKRLEQGRFAVLWSDDAQSVALSMSELTVFIEGAKLEGRLPLSPKEFEMSRGTKQM